jgi:hypothetical protein
LEIGFGRIHAVVLARYTPCFWLKYTPFGCFWKNTAYYKGRIVLGVYVYEFAQCSKLSCGWLRNESGFDRSDQNVPLGYLGVVLGQNTAKVGALSGTKARFKVGLLLALYEKSCCTRQNKLC